MKRTKDRLKQPKSVNKENNKISKNIVFAGLLALFVFIPDYIFFIPKEIYFNLNKSILIGGLLFISSLVFFVTFNNKKNYSNEISKYLFLFLLTLSIIIGFILKSPIFSIDSVLQQEIFILQNLLFIPTITFGLISIWINKNQLNDLINKTFIKDNNSKKKHFLFSQNNKFITIIFFIIIGISIFTVFYKLGSFDLYSDEGTTTQGAVGFYNTGEFKFWDFAKDKTTNIAYRRAIPHQILVALSYKIFGISTLSSRLPSAIFSLIFIWGSFFFLRYYIKDSIAALLIIFSFSFYAEMLFLERWARMYAIMFPSFLFLFYLSYRFFTETTQKIPQKFNNSLFFKNYLNFNYKVLPFFLLILLLNISLHVNTSIILGVLFLYILCLLILYKEKKYIIPIIIGTLIIINQIIHPSLFSVKNITFFGINNSKIYLQLLFGYPFNWQTNLIIITTGVFILFISKNKPFIKRYLLLYITVIFSWLFFALIIDFTPNFRYVSFLSPIAIILSIGLFIIIFKTLYNRHIQILFVFIFMISVGFQFKSNYKDLYIKNKFAPAKPSIAWKKIIKNYKKGEVIYRHWGPMLYFDDIDSSAKFKSIGSGTKYKLPLKILLDTLKNYKSGWLTWNAHNQYALYSDIIDYCNIYFNKVSGFGVDSLGVEIFHYSDSLITDISQFEHDRLLPFANLNLNNDFSITFLFNNKKEISGVPFYFFNNKNQQPLKIKINPDTSHTIINYLKTENLLILKTKKLTNGWHSFALCKKGAEFNIYIDGVLEDKTIIRDKINDVIKFKLNTKYKGKINDIRIYNFELSKNQINEIERQKKFGKRPNTLVYNNKEFSPLFHWQRK